MKKKFINLFLIVSIMFGFLPISVKAESISFGQNNLDLGPNTNFTIDINAQGIYGVTMVDVVLEYDPTIITYVGTSEGIFMDPFWGIMALPSSIGEKEILQMSIPCDPSVNGDGKLVSANFTTNGSGGTTDINLIKMEYMKEGGFDSFVGNTGAKAVINVIVPDTVSPTIEINTPTTADTFQYSESNNVLRIGGVSQDNAEVSKVTLSVNRGVDMAVIGINSWYTDVRLVEGSNLISVTSIDPSGNTATDTLLVEYTQIIPDTTKPTITINTPTNSDTYQYTNASNVLVIGGHSSDNVLVSSVEYSVNTGDRGSAIGTSYWSAELSLVVGDNIITVTSNDSSGNQSTDILIVNYQPVLIDAIAPIISGGSPIGTLPSQTTNATLSVTTNENAICHYSDLPNTDFAISNTFSSTGTLNHSTQISGLVSGKSYSYHIRCSDQSGNMNAADYIVSFSIKSEKVSRQSKPTAFKVSNFVAKKDSTQVILTWTNPSTSDFSKVVLLKSSYRLSNATTLAKAQSLGAQTIYEGSGQSFLDAEYNPGSRTYYYIYALNSNGVSGSPQSYTIRN